MSTLDTGLTLIRTAAGRLRGQAEGSVQEPMPTGLTPARCRLRSSCGADGRRLVFMERMEHGDAAPSR
jgi:hypothetical protein